MPHAWNCGQNFLSETSFYSLVCACVCDAFGWRITKIRACKMTIGNPQGCCLKWVHVYTHLACTIAQHQSATQTRRLQGQKAGVCWSRAATISLGWFARARGCLPEPNTSTEQNSNQCEHIQDNDLWQPAICLTPTSKEMHSCGAVKCLSSGLFIYW